MNAFTSVKTAGALPACYVPANFNHMKSRQQRCVRFTTKAVPFNMNLIAEIAEKASAAPGSVDAPIGVIIGAAAVVTVGMLLLSTGLSSGTDAAIKMQERDSKSGRYRK